MSISNTLLNTMRVHVERAYPNEGCGILLGHGHDVQGIYVCDNTADEPRHMQYRISPTALAHAAHMAKAQGMSVIGYYHSHPDLPSSFSTEDATYAVKGMLYIVASVCMGVMGDTSIYRNGRCIGERLLKAEQTPTTYTNKSSVSTVCSVQPKELS